MKVIKFLDKHFEEFLMVISLLCIVVVMFFQIIFRYFLNNSLTWSEEFCRYCFIWMMFLAFSFSAGLGTDLRVDAVLIALPKKVRAAIDFFDLVMCAVVAGFLFYHSFGTVAAVIKTGEYSTAMHLPLYFVYAASVVGYGLGTFRYVQRIVKHFMKKEVSET